MLALTATRFVRDRKGTPKNFSDKDLAELSAEFSGAICLKTLVLLGSALELFRKLFGAVRAILWLWGSVLALEFVQKIIWCCSCDSLALGFFLALEFDLYRKPASMQWQCSKCQ